ncbi:hypothetical protein HQO42_14980 [Rhodococcus fascians]|nr:hypothetical protein [Rhodococcus fascians]MBY4237758.1 hypothetical protein [Rhodococcus fascians]MBY4253961.1 hypothetical protein [Rhodococcus fascians]MBY4269168.1 hypothetical protein [Rhodococcus fascians]
MDDRYLPHDPAECRGVAVMSPYLPFIIRNLNLNKLGTTLALGDTSGWSTNAIVILWPFKFVIVWEKKR